MEALPLLADSLRWAIMMLAAVMLAGACLFARRQNGKNALGGRMSSPKVAWLFFAVYFWFLVCPLLAAERSLPPTVRWGLGLFGAAMWVRGVAELYLLYVKKAWRPPMGITHDVFCIVLVLGAFIQTLRTGEPGPSLWWGTAWLVLILLTLVTEIVFAWLFFRAVAGRTTGDAGVWFADKTERFRFINRLTLMVEVPLILGFAALLAIGSGTRP